MSVHSSLQNCYAPSRSISLSTVIAPESALITGSLAPSVIGDRPSHPICITAIQSRPNNFQLRPGIVRARDTILGFGKAQHCYPLSCGMSRPIRPVRRDKRKRGSGQGIRRFGSRSTQEGMPPPSRQNQDQSRNLTFNADFRHYPPPNLLDIWQYERKLA
jgi:hypothetical protein